MSKPKFHTVAALLVLIVSAIWVATGEFSSVGSAADENAAPAVDAAQPQTPGSTPAIADTHLKTVAYVNPDFVEHNRTIRVSGVTAPDKRAVLAVQSAGVIAKLNVEQGDSVKKDDIILTIDGVEKASMVETAKALLAQRQNEFDAISRLVKEGSSPKLQADNARSALAAARSQLEQAQADEDRLHVKAPFSGVIDKVHVEQGSYLQVGTPVATLLRLDPVVALCEVSENSLAFIKEGLDANVRLISGAVVSGRIRHISLEASPQTRTYPVEVEIPNGDLSIPSGMTAEITMLAAPVKAVILPRSVITLSVDGDLGIRVLKPDDTVGFVKIELIDDVPEGLVLGGIPDDVRIIVAGQDLVGEGDKVNAVLSDNKMSENTVDVAKPGPAEISQ
jgi:multidrug efflux system membrane fusion protein